MRNNDLCLTWYWEYDNDFAHLLEAASLIQGVLLWQITPHNILDAVEALYTHQVHFHALLDRAGDDLRFEPIRRWARTHSVYWINPPELSHWSEDKATMHLELLAAGLHTPYTIFLSPFIQEPLLPSLDLTPLGEHFVIKPAVGGGGEGVQVGVSSLDDIRRARLEFPDQKYLLQALIQPCQLDGQPAWFRVFYVAGECFPCWWNPHTHIYREVTSAEETRWGLAPLREVTQRIARICRLDWFSTEIALTEDGRFVVVDYVNDSIDTRLQSKAADGVPDDVMRRMAEKLVALVKGG